MQKIKVKRLLKTVDFEYFTVADVIKELKQIVKQYPDATFYTHSYEYSYEEYLAIFYMEDETDIEYEKRIASENKLREYQDAREKAEFERLKKKFG